MPAAWWTGCSLFDFQDDRPRNRVRHPEIALLLEHVAERVERRDHVRAGRGEAVHVVPLGDDAVALIAGLDQIDAPQPGPVAVDGPVRFDEFLVAAGLHLEPNGVESSHGVLPRAVRGRPYASLVGI